MKKKHSNLGEIIQKREAVATCVLDTLSVLDLSWLYDVYGEDL